MMTSSTLWFQLLRDKWVVLLTYFLATFFTDAYYMGDTPGYVKSILAYEHGGVFGWDNPFWEFGHLVWRPLGYVALHLLRPLTSLFVGGDERLNLTLALMWVNWLAGLACVLLLHSLLKRLSQKPWVNKLVVVALISSNAFLNYTQTGSSYIPGLALLLLAMVLLIRRGEDETKWNAIRLVTGAASLAGAVCLWFPYILAIPAVVALPVLLGDKSGDTYRRSLLTALAVTMFLGLAYGAVSVHLRIFDVARLKGWMTAAGHGYNQTGFLRMLFGLARSFVNMGQDGILFKRYLLHDPYNPVSLGELFRLSLWKFGFFYLTVATMGFTALRSQPGRRALAVLVLAAVPVFFFALFIFEGGMPERYLPLYPFFFLTFSIALTNERACPVFRYVSIVFVGVLIIANFSAMSKRTLQRRQDSVAGRISELQPRLRPRSLVMTVHLQDDLVDFYYSDPFHPLNRGGQFEVYSVLEPGSSRILTWKKDFASKVISTWNSGGDVWISKRLVQQKPRPEWNWVEGDDSRITWAALQPFFMLWETGEPTGGDDGFILLSRTPANQRRIDQLISGEMSE